MMAVTAVCDEKSVVDKARMGALSLPHKVGRTMSAVPQAPFGSRSGQAFSKRLTKKCGRGARGRARFGHAHSEVALRYWLPPKQGQGYEKTQHQAQTRNFQQRGP
jgi:hypothetical protein